MSTAASPGAPGSAWAPWDPGATNLITGVADANLDRAPVVAIAGQGSTHRLHKESHQIVDLVSLFAPVSKYATSVREPEVIPEVVRKAFKEATMEKPGASFIELPENIAAAEVAEMAPLRVQNPRTPWPPEDRLAEAAALIAQAERPMVLAGNGVIRAQAAAALDSFAATLNIPVAKTFMAKGVIPRDHPLSLGTAGLSGNDLIACGFARADLVICIGYDMVEYHPERWHRNPEQPVIHIGQQPAEVDAHYPVEVGVVGDLNAALHGLLRRLTARPEHWASGLNQAIQQENREYAEDDGFPLKPQKILWDLRQVLAPEDILISDVGAHKMWIARMWQAQAPNSCLISNGFAAMGIGVPGALAAKLVHPDRRVLTITGDAGFLMNSQELETALRLELSFVVLIWSDSAYGLIKWHQDRRFGRETQIRFNNPDFVQYAESFGARGYRVESAEQLIPVLDEALHCGTVAVVDCPVDYSQNMQLTERLAALQCPV